MNFFKNVERGLNSLNRTARTVNRTQNTMNNTKRNFSGLTGRNRSGLRGKDIDSESWTCACGVSNTSNFCGCCGKPPVMCEKCNIIVQTKFCPECGVEVMTAS